MITAEIKTGHIPGSCNACSKGKRDGLEAVWVITLCVDPDNPNGVHTLQVRLCGDCMKELLEQVHIR